MAVRIYACSNSCVFLALLSRHRDVFLAVCLFVLPRMMKKKKMIFFILFPLRLTTTQPWNRFWQIINFFRASDTFLPILHPHFFELTVLLSSWSVGRMELRWTDENPLEVSSLDLPPSGCLVIVIFFNLPGPGGEPEIFLIFVYFLSI